MLATSSIALLLSAVAVMAGPHQARARSHNDIAIARRVESDNSTFSLDKRADQFLNTEFTWYPTDTGPDACTGKNHLDSDYYVAMGYTQYGQGGCCGKQLRITANGKTATATCVDECATCPQYGQLDFTKDLFKFFTGGDLDVGVIYGSWSYVDGSDTTTTKQTTSTTHTTHTTTSTTHTTPTTTKAAPTTTSTEVTTETKDTTSAHPPAEVTTKTTTSTHTHAQVTTTTSADESAPSDDGDDGECIDEDDGDDNEDADEDDGDCDEDDDTSSTTVPHTSTTPAKVVSTPKPTTIEAVAPSKPTTTEEPAAPASSKPASKPTPSASPSSAKFSSAEKPSSPVATPSTTIAVVGNVATAPQSASDTQDTSVPDAINGGLGQGTSGAASLSASKVFVALVVVALAAVQL